MTRHVTSDENYDCYLQQYLGMCTTTTYFKSNGAIACGYDIPAGMNWNQASDECAKNGARLPEIAYVRENNEIFLRTVF